MLGMILDPHYLILLILLIPPNGDNTAGAMVELW